MSGWRCTPCASLLWLFQSTPPPSCSAALPATCSVCQCPSPTVAAGWHRGFFEKLSCGLAPATFRMGCAFLASGSRPCPLWSRAVCAARRGHGLPPLPATPCHEPPSVPLRPCSTSPAPICNRCGAAVRPWRSRCSLLRRSRPPSKVHAACWSDTSSSAAHRGSLPVVRSHLLRSRHPSMIQPWRWHRA